MRGGGSGMGGVEKRLPDRAREQPLQKKLNPQNTDFSQGALGLNLCCVTSPKSPTWKLEAGGSHWTRAGGPETRGGVEITHSSARCPVIPQFVFLPRVCEAVLLELNSRGVGCSGCVKWTTIRGSVESKELAFLVTSKETGRSLSEHCLPLGLVQEAYKQRARGAGAESLAP